MTGSLRSRAERAFKWSALTTAGRFCLQLVAQVVLARVLGPDNYGVYGIGMVVLTLAGFLSGNSFSYSLLLQKEVTPADVRFAFTWQVVAGVLCAGVMYAAAGTLAQFFGDPRVTPMVQWMAAACVFMALGSASNCLLQRDLNFRAIGLIQMVSYAAGYLAVGLPMALKGWGPQALAAACVVQAGIVAAASFALRPHSLKPLLSHALGRETLVTGRTVFSTNLVNWLLSNLDRAIMGRMLNTQAVGLYSVAFNLASIPTTLLVHAMQPTFLATGARLQHDPKQLGEAWMSVLACVLVFLLPFSMVCAMLAPDLVALLYGPAWSEAGWLLALLLLCVPAWGCLGLSTPVLWNTGRKHLEVRLQLPLLAVAVPAWWLLAPYGLRAIAIASAVLVFARAAVVMAAGMRALQQSWSLVGSFAFRGLALGALGSAAVMGGHHAAASVGHPAALLAAGASSAGIALLALIAVRPQVLGPQARHMLSRILPFVGPRWVAATPEARP